MLEAGSEELLALVRELADRLDPQAVRPVLRNPSPRPRWWSASPPPRLLAFYEVRRDLALHPRTPEPLALRLVPGLYWRDLVALGGDTRLRPRCGARPTTTWPRACPSSRRREGGPRPAGGPGLLAQLRHDPSPRVIAALLDNPRLTEDILAPVVHARTLPGRSWPHRGGPPVGSASRLAGRARRNPVPRLATSLKLLPSLRKPELKAVAADPRCPRRCASGRACLLGWTDRS